MTDNLVKEKIGNLCKYVSEQYTAGNIDAKCAEIIKSEADKWATRLDQLRLLLPFACISSPSSMFALMCNHIGICAECMSPDVKGKLTRYIEFFAEALN